MESVLKESPLAPPVPTFMLQSCNEFTEYRGIFIKNLSELNTTLHYKDVKPSTEASSSLGSLTLHPPKIVNIWLQFAYEQCEY